MTPNPACCTRDTGLTDVARMMVRHNCGAIPVIEGNDGGKVVGVITDRDIVCRTLADGKDPFQLAAGDCMSVSAITVRPEASIEECSDLMKQHKVRRVVVQDPSGRVRGMVAQADIARRHPDKACEVVRQVSQPVGAR